MKDNYTIKEVAKASGLSVITVKRACSISQGNRRSFGRALMPGLKSTVVIVRVGNQRVRRCLITRAALDRWLKARSKLGGNGQPRGSQARSSITLARKKKGVLPGPTRAAV